LLLPGSASSRAIDPANVPTMEKLVTKPVPPTDGKAKPDLG
jgi:hypothetical protein